MMDKSDSFLMNRRGVLKSSAAAVGGAVLSGEPLEAYPKGVNTNSSPSSLKITDLRVATVVESTPMPCPIIRIDTNQSVYGLGGVRSGASPTYALMLKSRLLGESPGTPNKKGISAERKRHSTHSRATGSRRHHGSLHTGTTKPSRRFAKIY